VWFPLEVGFGVAFPPAQVGCRGGGQPASALGLPPKAAARARLPGCRQPWVPKTGVADARVPGGPFSHEPRKPCKAFASGRGRPLLIAQIVALRLWER